MADNISVTAGSGTIVAADDVGGVLYQRVKLAIGADGSASDASLAAPLPSSDAGAAWTSVFGVSGARVTSADASAAAASVTDAPTAGQKIVLTDLVFSVDTDMRVDFKEETSGTVVLSFYMAANSTMQFTPRGKMKLATADKKLQVQTSAAGNIAVTAFYTSEA